MGLTSSHVMANTIVSSKLKFRKNVSANCNENSKLERTDTHPKPPPNMYILRIHGCN